MTTTQRRPGRQPGPTRPVMTIRLRPNLKALIAQAAAENGRSISEEMEFRLERAFIEENMLAALMAPFRNSNRSLNEEA